MRRTMSWAVLVLVACGGGDDGKDTTSDDDTEQGGGGGSTPFPTSWTVTDTETSGTFDTDALPDGEVFSTPWELTRLSFDIDEIVVADPDVELRGASRDGQVTAWLDGDVVSGHVVAPWAVPSEDAWRSQTVTLPDGHAVVQLGDNGFDVIHYATDGTATDLGFQVALDPEFGAFIDAATVLSDGTLVVVVSQTISTRTDLTNATTVATMPPGGSWTYESTEWVIDDVATDDDGHAWLVGSSFAEIFGGPAADAIVVEVSASGTAEPVQFHSGLRDWRADVHVDEGQPVVVAYGDGLEVHRFDGSAFVQDLLHTGEIVGRVETAVGHGGQVAVVWYSSSDDDQFHMRHAHDGVVDQHLVDDNGSCSFSFCEMSLAIDADGRLVPSLGGDLYTQAPVEEQLPKATK